MARMVIRYRRDGVIAIRHAHWRPWPHRGGWGWPMVWAAGGILVLLPLLLSVAVALPPFVFSVPPLSLGVGVWLFLRRLDRGQEPPPPPVIRLRGPLPSSLAGGRAAAVLLARS